MLKRILFFFAFLALSVAQADINVSPIFVNFGSVRVGSFATQTIWVSNRFNEPIQVSTSSNCYGNIQTNNSCFGWLQGYGSCTISVQYRPSRAGSDSCYIDVRDSTSDWKSVSVRGQAY